ncbi:MAG: peptide deformylase [Candidatus Kapabacteria bacterium]|nr:peptide deformylase [Ignavibacteriota bacterium]MCW5884646.1 peptide deformylase [Candidatus Kapabacteria bacterium]
MAVIPIYNCFHPVLKKKTKKIMNIDDDINTLVKNMFDSLYNISNGVGLAGNQVGHEKSLFITDLSIGSDNPKTEPMVFINPEILEFSDEEDDYSEGCLSIPDYYEKVTRPVKISVKYYDLKEKEHIRDLEGFHARVFQHEYDHLLGILMYERLSPIRRTLSKNKLNRLKRGQIIPDYPMIQPDGSLTGEDRIKEAV